MKSYSQIAQDKFVINILKQKRDGFFLEIGSNDPIIINNTYILEKDYNWKGIMIEYDPKYLESYKKDRSNSIHVINDATKIDYKSLFEKNNVPLVIDYLQIDLEVSNRSTLDTLEKLDDEILDKYKFSVITFEHDRYCNSNETREQSRNIFKKYGYEMVFEDISNGKKAFEDWYIHPSCVNMNHVNYIKNLNKNKYRENELTGKAIEWFDIKYE